MEVVRQLVAIVETYHLDAEVLAASIRSPRHMTEAALAGAHIATVPLKVLTQIIHHPLTDKGALQFRKTGKRPTASDRGRDRDGRASPAGRRPRGGGPRRAG